MRLLLILIAAGACASDAAAPAVAANPFTPRWITPQGDTVLLREDVRIGVLDGPDEYAFGYVTDVAVDATGLIYIFDSPEGTGQQLRQYSATGQFLRSIGRIGEGPGEYSAHPDVTVLANNDVLVADENALARFTLFTPDGEVRIIHSNRKGAHGRDIVVPTPDGGWISEIRWSDEDPQDRSIFAFVRHDAAGRLIDTIPPAPEYLAIERDTPAGMRRSFQAVFPDGGVVTANKESFDLVIHRGGVSTTIARSLERQRYTRLELDGFREEARRSGADPDKVSLPEFKYSYWWLGTLDSDNSYVMVNGAAVPYDDSERGSRAVGYRRPRIADILNSRGTYLGRLLEVIPTVMRGDTIWGWATGADGEQYVGRWVIER